MTYPRLLLSLSLITWACGGQVETEPQHSAEQPVVGQVIALEEITTAVPSPGTVRAHRRAEIATRLMARVSEIRVDVGSQVRTGQLLAVLGSEDLAASRALAEAAVTVAEAAREEAERQSVRMDTLLARDAVPMVQRDGAKLALVQAESNYAAARAALAQVESQASYSELAAPFPGRVVERFADPGDLANPGMPLLVVEDMSREGVVHVPVEIATSLRTGTQVAVSAGSARMTTVPIARVASGADPATRTVAIHFDLPEDWPTGADITALIPRGTHFGIAIPSNSIVRRGQLTGVRISTSSGVQLRWIRLGRSFTGADGIVRFEVLSGLVAGERITE